MADKLSSFQKIKQVLRSQIQDEDKLAMDLKLLRAAGLFVGSIVLIRNFGEYMAI